MRCPHYWLDGRVRWLCPYHWRVTWWLLGHPWKEA